MPRLSDRALSESHLVSARGISPSNSAERPNTSQIPFAADSESSTELYAARMTHIQMGLNGGEVDGEGVTNWAKLL